MGLTQEACRYVNRNEQGFVDFEKMLGLEGIALINVVSNWDEASITGTKRIQTRITHNDGAPNSFLWTYQARCSR